MQLEGRSKRVCLEHELVNLNFLGLPTCQGDWIPSHVKIDASEPLGGGGVQRKAEGKTSLQAGKDAHGMVWWLLRMPVAWYFKGELQSVCESIA